MKRWQQISSLSADSLTSHVGKLVVHTTRIPEEGDAQTLWAGRRVRHRFMEEGVAGQITMKWYLGGGSSMSGYKEVVSGKIISQVQSIIITMRLYY